MVRIFETARRKEEEEKEEKILERAKTTLRTYIMTPPGWGPKPGGTLAHVSRSQPRRHKYEYL